MLAKDKMPIRAESNIIIQQIETGSDKGIKKRHSGYHNSHALHSTFFHMFSNEPGSKRVHDGARTAS